MAIAQPTVLFNMLVGLPGSGKTSSYKNIDISNWAYDRPVVIISSDKVREELYGDSSVQVDPNRVFTLMRDRTLVALNADINVIYDATNISMKKRKNLLDYLKSKVDNSNEIIYKCSVFITPIDLCKKHNSERSRRVPEEVIDRMYLNFQVPLYQEGWDDICLVESTDWNVLRLNDIFCTDKRPNIKDHLHSIEDVRHDNPHHRATLKDHMRLAEEYLMENIDLSERSDINAFLLIKAVRYHDIGKFYTKTWKDSIAHYYGHENVGAYEYLTFGDPMLNKKDQLFVANLINYHMRPFNWDISKKVLDGDIKLFGQSFCDYLNIMHQCDIHCEDNIA